MIIVILCKTEENEREITVVSHGFDYDTMKVIILPTEEPHILGARYSMKFGEWIIEDYLGEEMDIFNRSTRENRIERKEKSLDEKSVPSSSLFF